jgi:hypothetical protein
MWEAPLGTIPRTTQTAQDISKSSYPGHHCSSPACPKTSILTRICFRPYRDFAPIVNLWTFEYIILFKDIRCVRTCDQTTQVPPNFAEMATTWSGGTMAANTHRGWCHLRTVPPKRSKRRRHPPEPGQDSSNSMGYRPNRNVPGHLGSFFSH